jgi:hypothetical protein
LTSRCSGPRPRAALRAPIMLTGPWPSPLSLVIRRRGARGVKLTLASAANTLIPAYLALLQRGFAVRREKPSSPGSESLWFADYADHRFVAEDPLMLLGLIALHETRRKLKGTERRKLKGTERIIDFSPYEERGNNIRRIWFGRRT